MPTHITIAHESTTTHSSSRSSSSLTDGEDSTGTGVHLSPLSAAGSQDYTDSLEEETEGWVLYPDEIGPSDSASRPRTSSHHHRPVEVSLPENSRRHHSNRRQGPHDRVHHHSHTRAHRSQPPIVQGSVESNEEWQAYGHGHGRGPHPPRSYQHWGHVAGHVGGPLAGHVPGHVSGNPPQNYAPSYSSSQPYSAFPASSLNPQTQQLVPFANPQTGYGYSPYQTATSGTTPGYYPTGHHSGAAIGGHLAAHAATPYNGQAGGPYNQEVGHHPSAAYYPYSMQGYPVAQPMGPPMFHQYGIYSPPMLSTTPPPPPPPPVDPSKDDEKFARLEKLLMDQKAEQDAKEAAAKKAAEDQAAEAITKKKIADDIAAAAAAAAAAATSEAEKKAAIEAAKNKAAADVEAAKHKAAAEKAAEEKAVIEKQKAEIEKAAAEKAAIEKAIADKAAAEKAAAQKAAAEKAAVEKAAAEVADQVTAAASAAATAASAAATAAAAAATPPPPPPPPAEKKKPIKFKDAVGRKFSFPFHLCNTWMGMEDLIKQAFLHVEVIGPHVAEGHYDLVGPNGEIILPQVWETMVEPDWVITMHMWPIPDPPPPPPAPSKAEEPPPAETPPPLPEDPPPPPPAPENPEIIIVPEAKKKRPPPKLTPIQAWIGGKSGKGKSLKVLKKPEVAIQHDIVCRVM